MKLLHKNKILDELSDESGAGTTYAMFMAFICICIGGLAIDTSNVWSIKQRLQAATDISAHAAAVSINYPGEVGLDGTTSEIAIAELLVNMPDAKFGTALQESDVQIGYWDPSISSMSESRLSASGVSLNRAVGVTARLDGEVGDNVATFILKAVGFDYWSVNATSIYMLGSPTCFDDGFLADGIVDISSNNSFVNGFCMHGNSGVDVNSSIVFGSGVRVSMPDSSLTTEGGMFALKGTNHTWEDGMANQLGDQVLSARLASQAAISASISALMNPSHADTPDYITVSTVNRLSIRSNKPLAAGQLVPNAVNIINCPNKGLSFPDGINVENMVIIADCQINFDSNDYVANAIIATTDTGNQSFNASSGLQLGQPDNCAPGGGVTLITMGESHFAASIAWDGVELFSHGDVHISAQANGINGVHIESAGDIKATSNLSFGSCTGGIDHYRDYNIVQMVY